MFPPENDKNEWTFANTGDFRRILLRISTEACKVDPAAGRAYPRDAAAYTIRTPSPDGHRGPTPPRLPVNFFAVPLIVGVKCAQSVSASQTESLGLKGLRLWRSGNQQWSSQYAGCWAPAVKPWANRLWPVAQLVPVPRLSRIATSLKVLQSALVRTFSTASFTRNAATKETRQKPENGRPCSNALHGLFL